MNHRLLPGPKVGYSSKSHKLPSIAARSIEGGVRGGFVTMDNTRDIKCAHQEKRESL